MGYVYFDRSDPGPQSYPILQGAEEVTTHDVPLVNLILSQYQRITQDLSDSYEERIKILYGLIKELTDAGQVVVFTGEPHV